MEFKKSTIFEKYNIKPNIDKNKLKVLFQTDPTKRKDLPIVVKILSNDEKLFEEELFTSHDDDTDLSLHSKLNDFLEYSENKRLGITCKDIAELMIKILSDSNYYKKFYYSSYISDEKAVKIFADYIDCIIERLKHEFLGSIGVDSNKIIKVMYNSICSIFTNIEALSTYKQDFDEDICDYLNNSLTLESVGEDFINRFNSLLYLNKIIKNDYYNNSLKYAIQKMNKDLDKYDSVLIACYEEISKSFKNDEINEVSSFINLLIPKNLNLHGELKDKDSKIAFEKLEKLQKCCVYYDKRKGKNAKDDDYEIHEALLDYIVFAGYEWVQNYSTKFKAMVANPTCETIYDLIKVIVSANPGKDVLLAFSNIIIASSSFAREFEYIMNTHNSSVEHISDKYIDPFFVDDFIAKYYWLAYTINDERLNKQIFEKLKIVGCDILAINNDIMQELQNNYWDYNLRDICRRKLIKTYNVLPGNWVMEDGKTISQLVSSLGDLFTGKDGKAEDYIAYYDALFKGWRYKNAEMYNCYNCSCRIHKNEKICPKCGHSFIEQKEYNDDKEKYDYKSDDDDDSFMEVFIFTIIFFTILALMIYISNLQ